MKSANSRDLPQLASPKDCIGCLACVSRCKENALSFYMAEDGHLQIQLDEFKCVGCKACEKICVACRTNYGSNDLDKSEIYAAWSGIEPFRKNGTSGGVFASIAEYIINGGGIVIGATLIENKCKHIMISNLQDIYKLQGSKYMFSSLEDVYSIIEEHLPKNRVLFTGVGCQCASVLAFFRNNKFFDNLFTMDLVCGGAPSRILVTKFLKSNPDIDCITSFRTKDKYQLKVVRNQQEITIDDKNLPLHGFNCGMTNRLSCYDCQYAKAHRPTDITIGDLWNYNYMPVEHAKGISTVIVHSERGKKLLNQSNIVFRKIKWSDCINYCKRVVWGKTPIFSPRFNLNKNVKLMSYDEFVKLYCIAMKPTDVKFELFRLYRFIVMRINDYRAKIYISDLIRKYEDR